MQSFWLVDYFAEKQQKMCPYFQDFSSNSSWLTISIYNKHKLCK
jgi:hypothetical protein